MLWLHELTGDESGWLAWDLRYMGFATWSATRAGVLRRAPGRLAVHEHWLTDHDLDGGPGLAGHGPRRTPGAPRVVECVRGNEVLFEHDRQPAAPDEIRRCAALLAATRADLLAVVAGLPDAVLDWEPPYAAFAAWARWRTVRQVLLHVAQTEVGYYLPTIGYAGPDPEALTALPWPEQLRLSRERTLAFLGGLAVDEDRLRLTEGDEEWSVRKVLRRLVWHELLHLKSIRRIVREFPGS